MGRGTRLVLLAFAVACSKRETLETKPKPATPPAPSSSAPSGASVAPPVASAVPAPLPVVAVVSRWNELHCERDIKGLAGVYAETVEFYGEKVARDRVLALKKAAFKQAPDYVQSVAGLRITTPSATRGRAEFTKSWTERGKTSSTAAVLEVANISGAFLVVKETDGPSEMKRAAAVETACGKAVIELLSHTEDVKNYLTVSTHTGLHLASEPPEQPTYSVSVYDEHPNGWETLAWFDVDPKTGRVEDGLGRKVQADPERMQKVVTACSDAP